jgi:hypothetical protein
MHDQRRRYPCHKRSTRCPAWVRDRRTRSIEVRHSTSAIENHKRFGLGARDRLGRRRDPKERHQSRWAIHRVWQPRAQVQNLIPRA